MILTVDALQACMGCPLVRAVAWLPHIDRACSIFEINTTARLAAFLAQIGHESGSLQYVAEIWGPTPPQQRYEGRLDLGNNQPGDGARFKGRGLIQTTGRANHAATRDGLRKYLQGVPDFEADPEALERPEWAALSAAWYWHSRGLNALADQGAFETITRRINGGLNGQADRVKRWERCKAVLVFAPDAPPLPAPPPSEMLASTEKPMAPFILAALPAIIEAVPKLASLFSSGSATAERNIKAAETVVSVAKSAIGAVNEQELVERLQSDPAAATAVREAIEKNWFEIHQAQEKSIAAARDFAVNYSKDKDVRTVVGSLTFIEVLALLMMLISAGGGIAVLFVGDFSAELRGAIVTLMLIGGWTGVREFFFGSSPAEQARADK